ncbi:cathepsin B-like [Adelges cooleyi]|uniref:cathepsin B-like n=1 Tax=Adelges cooleyi TaxID=133065 RepID=UPI0021802F83|nr:cathepsin B-like [Adelges cooleyi]
MTDDYTDQIYDEPTTEQAYFLTNDYIDQINEKATTWKAGRNFPLTTSVVYLKGMLGSKGVGLSLNGPVKSEDPNYSNFQDIPESFDAREQWTECQTIGHVRDQGNCGSSWAVATTSALSDRMCIATNGEFNETLSAEELTFCCHYCGFGCFGGWPILAWYRFKYHGCCTGGDYGSDEGCQPYRVSPCTVDGQGYNSTCNDQPFERNHKCSRECYGNTTVDYHDDHVYTRDAYHLTFRAIQKDVLCYGPIAASYDVYDDFLSYKSGVYAKTDNATYIGGHAVKLIGWGIDDDTDTPYWLLINSWNTEWGNNGTFKIERGTNQCRIDVSTTAGVPFLIEE